MNAAETLVSRYCAIDAWVNQLVVASGKDRLGLNPPRFGASAYWRVTLVEIGGFWELQSGEDVEVALALEQAGWRTRFLPGAVADNTVTSSVGDYWRQHVRLARGNLGARNARRRPFRARLVDRLEAWNVAAGYLDRVLFLAALILAGRRRIPRGLVPGAEVVTAVAKAGAAHDLPWFALSTVVAFPLALAAPTAALVLHVARRPQVWRSPRALPVGRGGDGSLPL